MIPNWAYKAPADYENISKFLTQCIYIDGIVPRVWHWRWLAHGLGQHKLHEHFKGIVIKGTVSTLPRHVIWKNQTYIDGLVQERRNSIANALELRLSCTNPWISYNTHNNTYGSGHEVAAILLPGFAINW